MAERAKNRQPEQTDLEFYEGLVRETASLNMAFWPDDYEDLCQVLRLKVWRAIESFRPDKTNVPLKNYVFSCVFNLVKDLRKSKKWRNRNQEIILSEMFARGRYDATDAFEARYLSTCADEVFDQVQVAAEPGLQFDELSVTLSEDEQRVAQFLAEGYPRVVIEERLGISQHRLRGVVDSLRLKLGGAAEAQVDRSGQESEMPTPVEEELPVPLAVV